jgi:hypothetical protein
MVNQGNTHITKLRLPARWVSGTSKTHLPKFSCASVSLRQWPQLGAPGRLGIPAGKTYRKGKKVRPKFLYQQADQCFAIDIVCVNLLDDHADLVDVLGISLMYYREDRSLVGLRGIENDREQSAKWGSPARLYACYCMRGSELDAAKARLRE